MTYLFRRIAVGLISVGLLSGIIAWAMWPSPVHPPEWTNDYDLTARPPEEIAAGTVVDRTAPDGWSHLIIKSVPRVKPEFRGQLLDLTVRMSTWMFPAFVADVRPEVQGGATRYRLRAVALGLGTSIDGRDVIITPETAADFGVELNWITREILTKGYKTQRLAVIALQGPTFALVDTPVWYRCGSKNHLIRFRYALLVDANTGRLDVLAWLLDPDGSCGVPRFAVLLAPNTVDEVELIPDMSKFTAGLTTAEDAFGVDRLPAHRAQVLLPTGLQALALQTRFTAIEASTLESGLRQLLHQSTP